MKTATYIDITFEEGIATQINGKDFNQEGIDCVLGTLADEYNIGASDILSNAKKALKNISGSICMKICNGSATPFAA